MSFDVNDKLIQQYSANRKIIKAIKKRFKITKLEFEVLCNCYSIQQPKQPYFFVPDVVNYFPTINKTHIYRIIRSLVDKGYLKISLETPQHNMSNYYIITGNGESILRHYSEKSNQ